MAETVRELGALSTVGFSFVLAIFIGAGSACCSIAGWAPAPGCFFLFFLFGLVAGVINVYRTAGKFLK